PLRGRVRVRGSARPPRHGRVQGPRRGTLPAPADAGATGLQEIGSLAAGLQEIGSLDAGRARGRGWARRRRSRGRRPSPTLTRRSGRMRFVRARFSLVLTLFAASLLPAGAVALAADPPGGALVLGLDQEPPTLDPHASPSAVTYQIIASVTESLLYRGP